ncbi:MAG: GGDEF domain-containing protein [Comamonadaceae bacterium]|nr:MAG: GGDEF domain-containing protein [Comamonadaceae bacterium]
MFSAPTFFLCLVLSQLATVVVWLFARPARLRTGLREWVLSGVTHTSAWLVFGLFHATQTWAWAVTAGLLSLTLALIHASFSRFLKHPLPAWHIILQPLLLGLSQLEWGGPPKLWGIPTQNLIVVGAHAMLMAQALQCWRVWPASTNSKLNNAQGLLKLCALALAAAIAARIGVMAIYQDNTIVDILSPSFVNMALLSVCLVGAMVANMAVLMLHQERAWEAAQSLAMTDALTGLMNRRALLEAGFRELALSHRNDTTLCVMLLDIDHFKNLNDAWGHTAGDQALQLFSSVLQETARNSDTVARYGGEEFCVLLPACSVESAAAFANRLRQRLGETSLRFSAGLSTCQPEETSIQAALARADAALYQAKNEGRDRMVTG